MKKEILGRGAIFDTDIGSDIDDALALTFLSKTIQAKLLKIMKRH